MVAGNEDYEDKMMKEKREKMEVGKKPISHRRHSYAPEVPGYEGYGKVHGIDQLCSFWPRVLY